MKTKILTTLVFCAVGVLAAALLTACGSKAPDGIALKTSALLLGDVGETYDLSKDVEINGGDDAKLKYSVSDTSVAEVSENGVVTAKGFGSVTVTVSAAADENVKATADVLVYGYRGIYTATKYIDAMGCDVRVRLKLNGDGTYEYYRYPMTVALSGGGSMPSLSDNGTYIASGNQFTFTGKYLGGFELSFRINAGEATLSGSMPTGGAKTQMILLLNSTEDRGENGVYTGRGETENGSAIDYSLTLKDGTYTLQTTKDGKNDKISSGAYSFENNIIEFTASEGASFKAEYNASRSVVEGTAIPVSEDGDGNVIALTLTKE